MARFDYRRRLKAMDRGKLPAHRDKLTSELVTFVGINDAHCQSLLKQISYIDNNLLKK